MMGSVLWTCHLKMNGVTNTWKFSVSTWNFFYHSKNACLFMIFWYTKYGSKYGVFQTVILSTHHNWKTSKHVTFCNYFKNDSFLWLLTDANKYAEIMYFWMLKKKCNDSVSCMMKQLHNMMLYAIHQQNIETINLRGLSLCCWTGTTAPITALSPWNCPGEFLACSVSWEESWSLSAPNVLFRPLTSRLPELPVPPEEHKYSIVPLLWQLIKQMYVK